MENKLSSKKASLTMAKAIKNKDKNLLPENVVQKLEMWDVEKLKPYEKNSRTHSPEQINQIAESIKKYGFNMPILAESDGSMICGHGRLMAAKKLNYSQVPVLIASHMSETLKRQYIIADNKIALNSDWDINLLTSELLDFKKLGEDISALGFDALELDDLLLNFEEEEPQNENELSGFDLVNTDEPPITTLGDIWICGTHRILCGTPVKPENVAAILQGAAVDFVIVSDPGEDITNVNYRDFEKTHKGADLIIFKSNLLNLPAVNRLYAWDKGTSSQDISDIQLAWTNKNGTEIKKLNGAAILTDIDELPEQKPAEVYEKLYKDFMKKGAVLEYYAGIGAGLIAAHNKKLQYYGIEINPYAVDFAVRDWQRMTGKKAILADTGETFGKVYGKRRHA